MKENVKGAMLVHMDGRIESSVVSVSLIALKMLVFRFTMPKTVQFASGYPPEFLLVPRPHEQRCEWILVCGVELPIQRASSQTVRG